MINISLPKKHEQNRLVLMLHSPNVLFAYWDFSDGQRTALANKGKLLLRLNAKKFGLYRVFEIAPHWDSFYFTDLDTGLEYFCEISVVDGSFQNYPIIISNSISTPGKTDGINGITGSPGFWGAGKTAYARGVWPGISSYAYYK